MVGLVEAFDAVDNEISSSQFKLSSDGVLARVRPGLEGLGFEVERGKSRTQILRVPVLFGARGVAEKSFDADAWYAMKDLS